MKFIVSLLLITILSFAAGFYLPWWSIAIVAFIVAVLIPQGSMMSFLSGFISLFIFWGLLSFTISSANENILAHRVSLLILKIDNPYLLMIATALIGGLVAGMASLTGSFLRKKKYVH